jgi:hypothetical protein
MKRELCITLGIFGGLWLLHKVGFLWSMLTLVFLAVNLLTWVLLRCGQRGDL